MNQALTTFKHLQTALAPLANAHKAEWQSAYMKFKMPFLGITKPQVEEVTLALCATHAPTTAQEYCQTVEYIFKNAQYREEWYAGLIYAKKFKKYHTPEQLDLYIAIVRMSQWWDIVDDVATNLVGRSLPEDPLKTTLLKQWIMDKDLWVRRTALLAQLKYKQRTDFKLLSNLILAVAHEKDFFIRKAIGWVLREYSKTDADAVQTFIDTYKERLSPLSIKEGLRLMSAKALSTSRS